MQEIENELRSLADRRAELDAEAAELRSRAVEHVAAVVKQLGITPTCRASVAVREPRCKRVSTHVRPGANGRQA